MDQQVKHAESRQERNESHAHTNRSGVASHSGVSQPKFTDPDGDKVPTEYNER